MRIAFTKMHGLGNDFVVLDARETELPPISGTLAAALADRRTGIGCDQLIIVEPSERADWKMRIFNRDGGEVEACGNAARAVGLLIGKAVSLETLGGLISAAPDNDGVAVDMGMPRFGWEDIPLAYAMDTAAMPVAWDGLENPVAVNVGNPHVVFFVDDVGAVPLEALGPEIENDPLFPERVNVNVAAITGPDTIALRVWERGAGLTRACGTGACATAVAAMKRMLTGRAVTVTLPGGSLAIRWGDSGEIVMTGPAKVAYSGAFDWGDFA